MDVPQDGGKAGNLKRGYQLSVGAGIDADTVSCSTMVTDATPALSNSSVSRNECDIADVQGNPGRKPCGVARTASEAIGGRASPHYD